MKKITIHKEATIKAEGKRQSRNCKPVICIETGKVFASATDAAEYMGVHYSMMSATCIGKVSTCKGMHFCYLNEALENLDAVMSRLRDACAMEVDAKKWRAQEAEKEAIRKAEERRLEEERKAREAYEKAVAKAEAKVAKCAADCAKYQEKFNASMSALDNANKELEALLDKGDVKNET